MSADDGVVKESRGCDLHVVRRRGDGVAFLPGALERECAGLEGSDVRISKDIGKAEED